MTEDKEITIDSFTDEELKAMALEIKREWDDGAADSVLKARWKMHEKLYQNQQLPPRSDLPNSSNYPIPLLGTKISQLVANICGGITSVDPYFMAKITGETTDQSDWLENDIHLLLTQAKFDFKVRKNCKHAGLYGKGFYKVTPSIPDEEQKKEKAAEDVLTHITGQRFPRQRKRANQKNKPGINLEVIHADLMHVFPSTVDDICDAKLVGDSRWRRLKWVREQMKAGVYRNYEDVHVGTGPDPDGAGRESQHAGTPYKAGFDQDDSQVEIASFIRKCDLNKDGYEEYYSFVMDMDNELIYVLEPYEFSRPWYFDTYMDIDIGENGFWWPNSPAYEGQGLHLLHYYLWNDMIDSVDTAAWPPLFGEGGSLGGDNKTIFYGKGTYNEVDSGVMPVSPMQMTTPDRYPPVIQMVQDLADATFKISTLGTGGSLPASTTATAASLSVQGQNAAGDEFHANFALGHIPMVEFVCEIMSIYFAEIKGFYGDQLKCQSAIDYAMPAEWEINGKTPLRTPQSVANSAMVYLNLSQNMDAGVDMYEVTKGLNRVSGLANRDKLQIPREAIMQAKMQAAAATDALMAQGDQADEDAMAAAQAESDGLGAGIQQPGVGGTGGPAGPEKKPSPRKVAKS